MEMKASLYHGKQSFGATLGKKTATSPYLRKFSGWCAIRCSFQKDGSGNWRTSDGISQPRQEHEFASEVCSESFCIRDESYPKKHLIFQFNRSHLYNAATKIKPLDLTGLSEDVSVNSIDAMKRTISGMLGILPSFEFTMSIDMKKESLVKLMQSALMTGFVLFWRLKFTKSENPFHKLFVSLSSPPDTHLRKQSSDLPFNRLLTHPATVR